MPFGIVGRTGPEMRHVVGFEDRSTGRVLLGPNLGHAIVTNGDLTFAATRPSFRITLDRLVIIVVVIITTTQRDL